MHGQQPLEIMRQLLSFLIACTFCSGPVHAQIGINNWTYAGAGGTSEAYWGDIAGSYCDGDAQSPINIVTSSTQDVTYQPFDLTSYDLVKSGDLENNGHSLEVDLDQDEADVGNYEVTGGGLVGTYRATQFHFHFGSNDNQGSEHTINGKSYSAEMHIVHYDTFYPNTSVALQNKDGIAVLGIFLQIGDRKNTAFDFILDNIATVTEPQSHLTITNIQLSALLPSDTDSFWRYDGSLTTPLCNEVVTWTIFKDTITISEDQLEKLRTLKSEAEDEDGVELMMADNYRPAQNINNRIRYSVQTSNTDPTAPTSTTGAAGETKAYSVIVCVSVLAAYIVSRL